MKTLFVIKNLPRSTVSVRAITEGREPVSGTILSCLLVADGLAARGNPVGIVVQSGEQVSGTAARCFGDLRSALHWAGHSGRVIWCCWGDEDTLESLHAAGSRPVMWVHTGVIPRYLRWLDEGRVAGIVTVSDSARLSAMHSSHYASIGRAYNPLSPVFAATSQTLSADRGLQLVFAGHLGESKGAHRVLQLWPHVRAQLPRATLAMAGSGRLYGSGRPLGPLGLTDPQFEERYLLPLVKQSGSLEAAGVQMVGLLQPSKLRELYAGSAVGIANLNWDADTETFCCSAVEMLASSLPVFGVARGALPETVGSSGGALLSGTPELRATADHLVRLLRSPERRREMREAGSAFVRQRYGLAETVRRWETLLVGKPDELNANSGPWRGPAGMRYWAEITTGVLGAGRGYEACISAAKKMRVALAG
jgi:glycosyltransferase involved in cell wall biosynthesis